MTRQRSCSPKASLSSAPAPAPSRLAVLLYIPNVVGYFRIALLAASVSAVSSNPVATAALLLLNLILDGVDGALARRLGQTSAFGAFLDVSVDLASRGLLWAWALPGGGGAAVLLLEALTFVCTHAASGAAWKDELQFGAAPRWVRAVMANGFKTPAGCLAVAGLMGCPLWLWGRRVLPEGPWSSPVLGAVLVGGRLVAAAVEVWVVGRYLGALLQRDAEAAAAAAGADVTAAAAAALEPAGGARAAIIQEKGKGKAEAPAASAAAATATGRRATVAPVGKKDAAAGSPERAQGGEG